MQQPWAQRAAAEGAVRRGEGGQEEEARLWPCRPHPPPTARHTAAAAATAVAFVAPPGRRAADPRPSGLPVRLCAAGAASGGGQALCGRVRPPPARAVGSPPTCTLACSTVLGTSAFAAYSRAAAQVMLHCVAARRFGNCMRTVGYLLGQGQLPKPRLVAQCATIVPGVDKRCGVARFLSAGSACHAGMALYSPLQPSPATKPLLQMCHSSAPCLPVHTPAPTPPLLASLAARRKPTWRVAACRSSPWTLCWRRRRQGVAGCRARRRRS